MPVIFSNREAMGDFSNSHVWEADGGCISHIAVEKENVGGGTEVAGVDSSFEKCVGGVGVDTLSFLLVAHNSHLLMFGEFPNLAERQSPPPTRYEGDARHLSFQLALS